MSDLRERMLRIMKLRGFSKRTISSYVHAVFSLARYYHRSPSELTKEEIQAFLLYLLEDRELAWNSCNVVFSGLRFFYLHVLNWSDFPLDIGPRRGPRLLPEILSRQELERLFESAANLRDRILLMSTYAAGLRVGEVTRLKISDIHSDRMLIRVSQGKGRKDRYTLLSAKLLGGLRHYWRAYRPGIWLFPGQDKEPLSVSSAQKIYTRTKERSGLNKGKGIHTLRHCFATHLLEAGVDLRTLQLLMGHSSIKTTLLYLQVTRKSLSETSSHIDLLEVPNTHPKAARYNLEIRPQVR